MPDKKNILFLLPVISHPRYLKRIEMLMPWIDNLLCMHFERDYFTGNTPAFECVNLGSIEHGKYTQRIFRLMKVVPQVVKASKKYDEIYCFGLDMLLIGLTCKLFNKRLNVYYEIGDIRSVLLGSGIVGKISRFVERKGIRRTYRVVVTSELFFEEYFKKILKISVADYDKFRVVENKIPPDAAMNIKADHAEKQKRDHLVIGYFGVLRCIRSLEVLERILDLDTNDIFRVKVYGKTHNPDALAKFASHSKVEYLGEYTWPDDLSDMYNGADVIWGCYPFGSKTPGNWQWAKTNRFYESCLFSTPIVSLKDSGDTDAVVAHDLGLILDLADTDEAARKFLNEVNRDFITTKTKSFETLPESVYIYTDDHEKLLAG